MWPDNAYGGTVVTDSIYSKTLDAVVKYNVYLPDDFDRCNKLYPVAYLLHGLSDDYTAWDERGRVALAADDVMSSGESEEMVIIMPNAGSDDIHNVQCGYFNVEGWNYEDFFFREFIPEVESRYRVIGDKWHRAIMGLSMGGGGSVVYCQHHPEMFSSCYAMSAWLGLRPEDERVGKDAVRDKLYLTCQSVQEHSAIKFLETADEQTIRDLQTVRWTFDCGDDDGLVDINYRMYCKMTEVGVKSEFRVRNGGHNWEYWHQALRLALPFATRSFSR